jgi:phosphoribosyl 1,2-cyclic phosphodiesterase
MKIENIINITSAEEIPELKLTLEANKNDYTIKDAAGTEIIKGEIFGDEYSNGYSQRKKKGDMIHIWDWKVYPKETDNILLIIHVLYYPVKEYISAKVSALKSEISEIDTDAEYLKYLFPNWKLGKNIEIEKLSENETQS